MKYLFYIFYIITSLTFTLGTIIYYIVHILWHFRLDSYYEVTGDHSPIQTFIDEFNDDDDVLKNNIFVGMGIVLFIYLIIYLIHNVHGIIGNYGIDFTHYGKH